MVQAGADRDDKSRLPDDVRYEALTINVEAEADDGAGLHQRERVIVTACDSDDGTRCGEWHGGLAVRFVIAPPAAQIAVTSNCTYVVDTDRHRGDRRAQLRDGVRRGGAGRIVAIACENARCVEYTRTRVSSNHGADIAGGEQTRQHGAGGHTSAAERNIVAPADASAIHEHRACVAESCADGAHARTYR